ncbi:type 2 lantipeptide synthetase LanM [Myxococcus sp. K15C18031901]|uniref:DUF4135 domain-containing protein n=1 Tax=Myxococcus dinghuensis TaxID=2906761 RepID=UPI0020A6E560|nr:DUF4135 domain-containing protein [Myxococcus dinghuensis]MCP3097347.1 type 2 lantipeptide synthetase LanM [Myxococcus dinghuensis]
MTHSTSGKADLLLALPRRRPSRATPLPPYTRALLRAVQRGRGAELFPPVVERGPDGVLFPSRRLAGADDASRLRGVLDRPAFHPWVELVESLGHACGDLARRHPGLLARSVLRVTNADLFGALLREAFSVCAASPPSEPPEEPRRLCEGFQAFFTTFLERLARDVRAGLFRKHGYDGPVVGLWSNPDETHNGRQAVLRVQFRRGGAVAYKPRPAGGEALFLSERRSGSRGSLFELLNALPPSAGKVCLPTMRIFTGRGADRRDYAWHEWIPRPRRWGVLRSAAGRQLEGCRLEPRAAERFWHDAGALSAACFALGVADLYAGNLLVGQRPGERRPLLYPVDLELYFSPLRRLPETGLVSDVQEHGNHHVGLERLARWCAADGPSTCFFETPSGGLQLRRRREPWGRQEARSVIGDTRGHIGFGAYLPSYLRGMFDLWALLLMERPRVTAFLRRNVAGHRVRVLVKATTDYVEALDDQLLSRKQASRRSGSARFSAEEQEQLRRLDVPYFFKEATGGPLRYLRGSPGRMTARRAGPQRISEPHPPPSQAVLEGGHFDLMNLGAAVRDAVAFVFPDVGAGTRSDTRLGVHLDLRSRERGQVTFDWKELERRLVYVWNRRELSVRAEALPRRSRQGSSVRAMPPVAPRSACSRCSRSEVGRSNTSQRVREGIGT